MSLPDGILVTTGTGMPGTSNQHHSGFDQLSVVTSGLSDSDVENLAEVDSSTDAFAVEFDFTVTPGMSAVRFSFMFGSEEYPDYVDQITDGAAVIVDGVNWAKFTDGTPLKIVSQVPFQDNNASAYSIEYNGISKPLDIIALLNTSLTTHHVKIVIADSTYNDFDTGLFLSPFTVTNDTSGGIGGGASAPTVTTAAISGTTAVASVSGGNVTDDGGDAVTERGVCWNTTGSPTIADSKTSDGTGTGVFVSNLTNLSASTTYYVRAYATNGTDTGYGSEVSFTTLSGNNAPVAAIDSYIVYPGVLTSVSAGAGVLANDTDADIDPLTAILNANVPSGTLALAANGSFDYTALPGIYDAPFTYHAFDGTDPSNVTTATIHVLNPTWTGTGNLSDPTHWNGLALPQAGMNPIILSGLMTINQDLSCHDLLIYSTAGIAATSGAAITISGTLKNENRDAIQVQNGSLRILTGIQIP